MMLYSDGTTKFGCSYTTFEVQKNDGQLLAVEMGEVGQLMPKHNLMCLFQEILGTICHSLENKDEIITSTFINIKNLRSDCCAVQKQCNDLFIEFWKNLSKNATKNFGLHSLEQQENMTKVNQFFLQLALFGSLCIDQAEACLKVWEQMLYPGQKVGCLSHGGYSNGESGATIPVQTVCNLKDEFEMASVTWKTSLGNRFNIFFVNGLIVYQVHVYYLPILWDLSSLCVLDHLWQLIHKDIYIY